MKVLFTLAFVSCAMFLAGCADNSLMTDEEYNRVRGPAAYSPDPTGHMPQSRY